MAVKYVLVLHLSMFIRMRRNLLQLIFVVITLSSCVKYKQMVLFRDVPEHHEVVNENGDYRLRKGDLLNIRVSSVDAESVEIFNKRTGQSSNEQFSPASLYIRSYQVDLEGNVDLPIVGKVSVQDKTLEEAAEMISAKISEYYKYFSVDVKLVNFLVTVLGEVKAAGTISIFQTKMTLPQVVGQVGGFSDYADVNHIMISRVKGDKYEFHTVDLASSEFLASEYYYVQPGDMIYVKPLKPKRTRVNSNTIQITISALTFVLLIYNIMIR